MSAPALRLGVIVPCRDEAAVIERKLANLRQSDWPAGALHRVVVVDDGSEDDTRARATAALSAADPRFEAAVVANALGSGKCSAVRAGLAQLGAVDLVVLTDADVVLAPGALVALAAAFAAEPELLLASGAQVLVESLAAGARDAADGARSRDAADLYDRWTERVRAFESRSGRLFSVHGQLVAWRAGLGLEPAARLAADDLDLVFQARARGARVRRIAGARFIEEKTPRGARARAQALRRAQAYFQALEGRAPQALGPGLLDRTQCWFYRRVPACAPELALVGLALAAAAAFALAGPWGAAAALLAFGAGGLTRRGRELVRLLAVIRVARPARSFRELSDRWRMPREEPSREIREA